MHREDFLRGVPERAAAFLQEVEGLLLLLWGSTWNGDWVRKTRMLVWPVKMGAIQMPDEKGRASSGSVALAHCMESFLE